MRYLYTNRAAARQQRLADAGRLWMWLIGGLSLIACIVMCTQVCTANAERLLLAVIGTSILGGWAVILLLNFVYLPSKRQAEHILSMLDEAQEAFEGVLSLSPVRFTIPRSIVIRKVRLTVPGQDEPVSLSINALMAKSLPANGTYVRVLTARRYIIAAEAVTEGGAAQ